LKAKAPRDMQRPNRRFGDVIRALVSCPLCGPDLGPLGRESAPVRVVAYRRNTVRLACPLWGLRFSVDRAELVAAIGRDPASFRNAMALTIDTRHEGAQARGE
jgi:hypothetical protein